MIHVDDSLLAGGNCDECKENILITIDLLQKLGFIIHPETFVFEPFTQVLRYIIDTISMTIASRNIWQKKCLPKDLFFLVFWVT